MATNKKIKKFKWTNVLVQQSSTKKMLKSLLTLKFCESEYFKLPCEIILWRKLIMLSCKHFRHRSRELLIKKNFNEEAFCELWLHHNFRAFHTTTTSKKYFYRFSGKIKHMNLFLKVSANFSHTLSVSHKGFSVFQTVREKKSIHCNEKWEISQLNLPFISFLPSFAWNW
jgi:hypothetical protein